MLIGAKLNNGGPIRSVSPQHTLRLNRFGDAAPEDEQFQTTHNMELKLTKEPVSP
jgi:hypothetical protein